MEARRSWVSWAEGSSMGGLLCDAFGRPGYDSGVESNGAVELVEDDVDLYTRMSLAKRAW